MRRIKPLIIALLCCAPAFAQTPLSDISATWDDAGTDWDAIKIDVTDTASGSGSDLLDLQIGGSTRFGIRKTGEARIVSDSVGLLLGSGGDASIRYDGTDMVFDSQVVGSGSFQFNNGQIRVGTLNLQSDGSLLFDTDHGQLIESGGNLTLRASNGLTLESGNPGAGDVLIVDDGVTALSIVDGNATFAQNVGIGTAPTDLLTVGTATSGNAVIASDGRYLRLTGQPGTTAETESPLSIDAVSSGAAGRKLIYAGVTSVEMFSLDVAGKGYFAGDLGIGEGVPKATLDVDGGLALATAAKTANYTASGSDHVIACNATGGGFTVTLPAAASSDGLVLVVKKTDSSSNAVTVDGNASETIDGEASYVLSTQFDSITLVCDGTEWHAIAYYTELGGGGGAAAASPIINLRADTEAFASAGRDLGSGGSADYSFWLSEPLVPYMADFAVSAWIQLGSSAPHTLISTGTDGSNDEPGFKITIDQDSVGVYTEDVESADGRSTNHYTAAVHDNPGSNLSTGTWYHVLVLVYHDVDTHNGFVKSKVYVDGQLWDTETHAGLALNPITWAKHAWGGTTGGSFGCTIGGEHDGTAAFPGKIVGLRYWEHTPTIGGTDTICDTLFDYSTIIWLSSSRRSLAEISARGGKLDSDLIHAWECTDLESEDLLDYRGENHGVKKNGTGDCESIAGTQKATVAGHGETVGQWVDSESSLEFEGTAASMPVKHDEIVHGQPGLYFDGAAYLQESAATTAKSIYVTIKTNRSAAWPNDGTTKYTLVSYSDISETNKHFELRIQDDGKIEVHSNNAGSTKTLLGTTVLKQVGTYHVVYSDGKIYLNGAEETTSGTAPDVPSDLTGLDTITVGALETTGGLSNFADDLYVVEVRDYDAHLTASQRATIDSYAVARYGKTYYTSDYADLAAAVTAIGSSVGDLHIDDAQTLTGNVTIPSTCHLRIVSGGSVDTGGYTLTVNGLFWSDEDQVITCDSTYYGAPDYWYDGGDELVLADCRFDRIRADWFAGSNDAESVHWAVNCAHASSVKTVYLESDTYTVTVNTVSLIVLRDGYDDITVRGKGRGLVTVTPQTGANTCKAIWCDDNTGCLVENLTFDGNATTASMGLRVASDGVGSMTVRRFEATNYRSLMCGCYHDAGDTLEHCSSINSANLDLGSHAVTYSGTGHVFNCVVGFESPNGTGNSGQGIDGSFDPHGKAVAAMERINLWGWGTGSMKHAFSGSGLDGLQWGVDIRHARLLLSNGGAFSVTYTHAQTNADISHRWHNVWADAGIVLNYNADSTTQCDVTLQDVTLDFTNNINYPSAGTGFSASQPNTVVDAANVTMINTGTYAMSIGTSTDRNITWTFRNLQLHGCNRDTVFLHAPLYAGSSAKYGDYTFIGGEIENSGSHSYDRMVDLFAASSVDFNVTFQDVKFGGTDKNDESGIRAYGSGTIVTLYDCDVSDVDANHYNENSGGTVDIGSRPDLFTWLATAPGTHLFDAAEAAIGDTIDLGSDDIRVIFVMSNTTAHAENSGITYVGDLTTLDECDGTNYPTTFSSRLALTGESYASHIFDANDVSIGSLGDGTRELRGAIIYKHVTSDSDSPIIAYVEFGEQLGTFLKPGGQDFLLEWDSSGIFEIAP